MSAEEFDFCSTINPVDGGSYPIVSPTFISCSPGAAPTTFHMDPLLLGHARLRRSQSRRSLRASHGAFAGLLAAILVLAVVWAHSPEVPGPSPVGTLATVAGLTYLPGTAIPAPPSTYTLRMSRSGRGGFRFRSREPMDLVTSQELFSFYLTAMSAEGWTLLGKGDPSPRGWTLSWRHGGDTTLLALITKPAVRFAVDRCPPEPYC